MPRLVVRWLDWTVDTPSTKNVDETVFEHIVPTTTSHIQPPVEILHVSATLIAEMVPDDACQNDAVTSDTNNHDQAICPPPVLIVEPPLPVSPEDLQDDTEIRTISSDSLIGDDEQYQPYCSAVASYDTTVEDASTLIEDTCTINNIVLNVHQETFRTPRNNPVHQLPAPYSLMGSADIQDLELSLEAEPPPKQATNTLYVESYTSLVGFPTYTDTPLKSTTDWQEHEIVFVESYVIPVDTCLTCDDTIDSYDKVIYNLSKYWQSDLTVGSTMPETVVYDIRNDP